ncbi:MAG: hypothetical protein WA958_00690 [Tunicatimonas sp.]
MNRYFFSFLSIALIFSSCQTTTTTEADPTLERAQEIYAEAIAVHDEVMPRMDEIMQLRQKLQLRVTSMQEQPEEDYADSLQQMQTAIENLQQADQAMMQWMRSVQKVPGLDEVSSDYQDELNATELTDTVGLIQRQLAQKEAIEEVKQQMEQSIAEAEVLIGLPANE